MLPVLLLSFLAVDERHQRMGYGTTILGKAIQTFYEVVIATGIPALVLHCIDEGTKRFYVRLGFKPYSNPLSSLKLYLPAQEAIEIYEQGMMYSASKKP